MSPPLAHLGAGTLEPLELGGLMLAESGTVTLAVLAWLFVRASRQSERGERLVELARARGNPLGPTRVRRAVRMGQEPRLRERLDAPSR